ncbi:hypothetical protein KVR01_012648 [Diaporthe batatas]|uniref:uncharacterized protein n=1 Tax=Diaporthe batatas TaxID=748121 RepID=UPI001D0514CE|nr:uncharacterized protein KVR01_012648 [Diaporthe batatas]KAG8157606.1 hypothetical protein KVR01_012648 [Diaporthe batatas]
MFVFIFSRLVLLLLPASISAAAMDRVVFTPGHSGDITNTSSLVRRDNIGWFPDEETQATCDSDATPEKTEGSEFLKADCTVIVRFNHEPGRYVIRGYAKGKWAQILDVGTCAIAVARNDDSTDDFDVGDKDIRDSINAAMGMYEDPNKMKSVTGEGVCDPHDESGNEVQIKWKVADPEDLD